MPEAARFWKLTAPESVKRYVAWAEGEVELDTIICPTNPGHRRPGRRRGRLSVVIPDGQVTDFMWTWLSECLISDWTYSLLTNSGVSGFEVRLIEARRADTGLPVVGLRELVVTGWGGVAPAASGIRLVESCTSCSLKKYSCFDRPEDLINLSSWDGSDIFMVWPLPRFTFVSERVADLIRREELSGVRLEPVRELRCTSGSLTPGRLSWWLPHDYARAGGGNEES